MADRHPPAMAVRKKKGIGMDEKDMRNWIVVVDDEAMSLTSARVLLASENMKISCLPSGKSLLKFMEKNHPDLILLDVMMPEMDGFETLTALREQEKKQDRPQTPIIFLTGDSDYDSERHGLKLGAADYIHKPFNKDILISRIHKTIDHSRVLVNLTEDATRDKLTGFFNRSEGVLRIREALGRLSGALLAVDLDSFKLVNDLFGHEKGDQILKAFADLSRESTREGDILCRIGGDEFLFFCCGLHMESAGESLTMRLNKLLEERAGQLLGIDHGIPLGISVGAVLVPEYGTDYDVLFPMADEAMYKTKQNGKHGFTLYSDSTASGESVKSPKEELERICKIIGERNEGREAMVLGNTAFSTVFQFLERYNAHFGTKTLTVLFIVTARKSVEDSVLTRAADSFGELLKVSLSKADVILQSKYNQYLVLIPLDRMNVRAHLVEEILAAWEEQEKSADFEIRTASFIR